MTAKRLAPALIAALFISAVFTFYLSKRLAKAAGSAPAARKQQYVAAGQALEAGEVLKPGSLQLIDWPTSMPLTGGFLKIEDVAGRIVLYPLAKGEPILERHLAAAGAEAGLTANIPTGMRAISVRSDEVVGVAGFLQPGTHVDVLLTYRSERSPDPRTATVLQDAVILAAGQQIHPDPEGKPTSVNVVTLLLKPDDAERLVLATSLGAIHFVLRNGGDTGQTPRPSVGLGQLAGTDAPDSVPAALTAKPARPAAKPYEVETILGDKQSVNSFN